MDAVDVLVAFPCLVCHVYEPPFPPVRSADDAGLTGSEHQVAGAVVCHVVESESHKPRAVALAPYSDDVLAFSDESAVYGDEAVVGFGVGVGVGVGSGFGFGIGFGFGSGVLFSVTFSVTGSDVSEPL